MEIFSTPILSTVPQFGTNEINKVSRLHYKLFFYTYMYKTSFRSWLTLTIYNQSFALCIIDHNPPRFVPYYVNKNSPFLNMIHFIFVIAISYQRAVRNGQGCKMHSKTLIGECKKCIPQLSQLLWRLNKLGFRGQFLRVLWCSNLIYFYFNVCFFPGRDGKINCVDYTLFFLCIFDLCNAYVISKVKLFLTLLYYVTIFIHRIFFFFLLFTNANFSTHAYKYALTSCSSIKKGIFS